ncbi:MAG: TIGR03086 family metal-binding protein [Candidatus Dormibacteraeota bacterium]|nr:TIGR03086 family metal-binding protein [Candidatus Dormibacteraeota bacterium]
MVLEDLRRTVDVNQRLIEAILPWQLNDGTPCAGWTLQALLDHVVHGNRANAAVIRGEPPPPPGGSQRVPRAAFARTGRALLEGFSSPGVMERGFGSPLGELPGAVLAQHVVNELVVHAWDFARATRQPTDLVPDVAQRVLAALTEWGPMYRHLADVCQSDQQPAPKGAAAADRVAAILGRMV